MKKLVIIDAYALAHRSYHALPPLISPAGVLVNGVYGFMLVFLKMLHDLKPDYLMAAFDLAQPTFRHKEYQEYKAQRVKAPENFYGQVGLIKEIFKIWQIPMIEKEGFEADDLIGAITQKFKKEDLNIIILTGDLDALQLVDDRVCVYTLRRGLQDSVIYDKDAVRQKYDLEPAQLIDFKALKGDASDNVTGVPGVGEKTALKLIKEFKNLDQLYAALESQTAESQKLNSKLREKLTQNKKQAYLSQRLVTIEKNIDLEFQLEESAFRQPPEEELTLYLQKLGFQSLIKRIFNLPPSQSQEPKQGTIGIIDSFQSFNLLQDKIKKNTQLGLLLDSQGGKYHERKVSGLYIILSPEEIFYLPLVFFKELKKLTVILENKKNKTIFTLDAKSIIEEIGALSSLPFEDLAALSWLIDSERKNYDLESLTRFFLKKETPPSPEACLSQFLALAESIKTQALSLGLNHVWETIEKPLIPILAQMEINGIFVNREKLDHLQKEVEKEIKILEEKIYQSAQKTFNINSYRQLAEILFEDLKLDIAGIKKTNSGRISTDIAELSKIQRSHPIIPLIINYRQLEKLNTAFLVSLPQFINKKTQRIHTNWKQTATATGRLASEKPNLQNIPLKGKRGKEIRAIFEAAPGFSLLSLDYSQIELRLASHLSLDPKMIEAFKNGKDIHKLTASYINNVEEDEVTPEMRRFAKTLNFGIIYGMGDRALSEAAGISLKEAKKFKEEYFRDFAGLKNYLEQSLERVKKLGYAETVFGRKRFLPLIGSLGQIGRQEERIAINMPIQGLAADIIKLAMIKITEFIKNQGLERDAKLILQIHDELILEIKSAIIEEIAPQLKNIMEHVVDLEVPLQSKMAIGQNWGALE